MYGKDDFVEVNIWKFSWIQIWK